MAQVNQLMTLFIIYYICISLCHGACPRARDLKLEALRTNKEKFNKLNNEQCYQFQFFKSFFGAPCLIQPMDVSVVDNQVQSVQFAEGNDFALDNYCNGLPFLQNNAFRNAEITIDAIFDIINESMTLDFESVDVTYHPDGFPLSISIDMNSDPLIADELVFYHINCVKFCLTSEESNGYSGYNYLENEKRRFNSINRYSCDNIRKPERCPVEEFQCNQFYDGCNS